MSEKLSGFLSEFPLSDIIQLLIMTPITGELEITSNADRLKALLYSENGNLIHAECGGEEGAEAFDLVLRWK